MKGTSPYPILLPMVKYWKHSHHDQTQHKARDIQIPLSFNIVLEQSGKKSESKGSKLEMMEVILFLLTYGIIIIVEDIKKC